MDTGISDIDDIQAKYDYRYELTLSGGSYNFNTVEIATQTLAGGVQISGEIVKWSDSDNILHLVGVGSDDGKYHTFISDRSIISEGDSSWTVTSVAEANNISANEQNDDFSTEAFNFLDFTEDNPFGDPENN
mgnify:CR=1 FL=1